MSTLVESVSAAIPGLPVRDDEADRLSYARDLWPRHHLAVRAGRPLDSKPAAIAWPRSTEEVAAIASYCAERGIAMVPFGAGSGVCGGVLPGQDALVVDVKRMETFRRIDRESRLVDVECGAMGVPFEERLGRAGLTLGHFPSSILCSTVGGWIAGRGAGQCSGYYGKIEDMVVGLELVTAKGDVVRARARQNGPSLVPLLVGSEGTLGILTSALLRVQPAPTTRALASWSFRSTEEAWEGMRELFQSGLRPAVLRLYDPFDAMLARMGAVKKPKAKKAASSDDDGVIPGMGASFLRTLLQQPTLLNELVDSKFGSFALGGALVVAVWEGVGDRPGRELAQARAIMERMKGRYDGEGAAARWLAHRYSVSYRQAPVIRSGLFVDTFEVAAPWSKLGALYDGVREAVRGKAFIMAHMSHAYPDGCCIYFSFAGSAGEGSGAWDARCEERYDAIWRDAMAAANAAGGTVAHHHGVGRSKAPALRAELGAGVDVIRAVMKAMDPAGVYNPGNLQSAHPIPGSQEQRAPAGGIAVDHASLLAHVSAEAKVGEVERALRAQGLTLGLQSLPSEETTVRAFVDAGLPGTRDRWHDPVDQDVSGYMARTAKGALVTYAPGPRRAAGPDLWGLVRGARGRFLTVEQAWLRVHRVGVERPEAPHAHFDRNPALAQDEAHVLDVIAERVASV
jgi:alkyldihydroxyacetonephosphate synthase